MSLAIVAAGFTPGEADQLRRSIAGWKRKTNEIRKFQARLIDGMLERGHTRQFAEQVFTQISGFAGYGFPESHAASFALLVYASCWLKRHKPAAFAAALINSQPMGFYQPAQLVRDAAAHGVTVLPIDVNISQWDCTLEGRSGGQPGSQPAQWGKDGPALRLGMCLVKGLSEVDANRIADSVRKHGKMESIARLRRLSQASTTGLRRLAAADAFTSMGLTRQTALWSIRAMNDDPMPLFDGIDPAYEPPPVALPKIKPGRLVLQDYGSTGLSLKAHPLSFIRSQLSHMKVTTAAELQSEQRCPQGRILRVAGIVLVRQRPGTASGVVFITLEDETGSANLILWSDVFERFRRVARHSRVIMASGHIERRGDVVHLHVRQLESLDELIPALDQASRDFH